MDRSAREWRRAPTPGCPYGARILIVCAALLAGAATAAPAPPKLSATDQRALAEMALQWAIDGGIDDFKLAKDPSNLVVSNANLPAKTVLVVPGRTVTVLSPPAIQARADKEGDFLYFRFGGFSFNKDARAEAAIALVWAVSTHSTSHYLSGGGATLTFEKRNGKWELLPVTNRWMS